MAPRPEVDEFVACDQRQGRSKNSATMSSRLLEWSQEPMADVFSKKKRSKVMAAIRSKGNKDTEGALALIFRAHNITGWRRQLKLPGSPDFAFPERHLAIFVDGCFWHGCKKHSRLPKSNVAYWRAKLGRNVKRDRRSTRLLRQNGWKVLRFWEHSLRREERVVERVKIALAVNETKR